MRRFMEECILAAPSSDPKEFAVADINFHKAIARATYNEMFIGFNRDPAKAMDMVNQYLGEAISAMRSLVGMAK